MNLTDTHCHIHSADYPISIADVDVNAARAGVTRFICVGTDAADSERAVDFVRDRPNSWAVIGQHPHEAKFGVEPLLKLRALLEAERNDAVVSQRSSIPLPKQPPHEQFFVLHQTQKTGAQDQLLRERVDEQRSAASEGGRVAARGIASDASSPPFVTSPAWVSSTNADSPPGRDTVEVDEGSERRRPGLFVGLDKIVAIGECGLDYFYNHSSKTDQEKALRYQIELALEFDLPLVFHVREAFDDFWPIFDSYQGLRGELHSFTDNLTNLNKAISRGLYIGVNGIMTFTKDANQLEVAQQIPIDKILLETDSPFLTPSPHRGTVNEPARVLQVADFLAHLRGISLESLAVQTTTNARQFFLI